MKNVSSTLATLALLLASGCAPQHTYTPPRTLEGQACTAVCNRILDECIADQGQPGAEVNACADEARDGPMTCPPGTECPPVPCRHVSDDSVCGEEHRKCYRDCGGVIDKRAAP